MATVLNLIEGGTTTGLNDATAKGTKLIHYTPKAALISVPTVTEQCTVLIDVATVALLDSEREEIILRLYNAHARQTNRARDRTYVSFQPDGVAGAWRSEILDGRIVSENDIHKEGWAIKKIEVTIEWTRRNYWEGAEAQLPLTNTNGTDDTAGLEIFNCNDGVGSPPADRVNYVDVKAANVDGELPSATRLEITRDYVDADNSNYFFIGHNAIDPSNHQWVFEAESATGGTPTVDATSSNGNMNTISIGSGPSFADMLTWTVAAADVDDAKGGMMKAIIRFATGRIGTGADVWYRIKLVVASQTMFISGRSKPGAATDHTHAEIATFNFPPWLRGQTGNAAVDLILQAQQETGGALTPDIDVLYLIPAEDGWQYIVTNDRLLNTERLVDDGIEDEIYIDDGSGSDKRSAAVGYGNSIMVEPNKLQRLYFLVNNAEIARKHTVKLYYRPRRLTV